MAYLDVIQVRTDDYTRVLDERRLKMEKYEKMKKLVKVKDDLIWNLIIEKRKESEKEIEDLKHRFSIQMNEMNRISDEYKHKYLNTCLICHFCSVALDNENVNGVCMKNSSDIMKELKGNNTNMNVPHEHLNNRRHYFGKPKDVNFNY